MTCLDSSNRHQCICDTLTEMKLVFIRHGEPDFRARQDYFPKYEGRRYDLLHLSGQGCKQIVARIRELRGFNPNLILSSPYTRSLHTAAILSRAMNLEVVIEPELHDWLPVQDPSIKVSTDLIEQKAREFLDFQTKGLLPANRTWETEEELRQRIHRVFKRYEHLPTVIVSTHEAVIKSIIRTENVPYGALFHYDWEPI